MELKRDEILLLFDIDKTLTAARSSIEPEFEQFLIEKIKPRGTIGIITGANIEKIYEQLNGPKILQIYDYIFPENGLVQIVNGIETGKQSIQKHLGEETIHRFISFALRYIADLQLPFKRGTFLEFRNGMMNICPCGRQCSVPERKIFHDFDVEQQIRSKMIEALKTEFHDVDLTYSVGGQISFDVYPNGWDKSYCLNHVGKFQEIHFFGDQTELGGNDYEIYNDARTIGHKVDSPADTRRILENMFGL